MAYAVRATTTHKESGETYVTATCIIYATTVAEALEQGSMKLGIPAAQLTADMIDDAMSEEQVAKAQALVPGGEGDEGMVANITDEMRGASQDKVYGSG